MLDSSSELASTLEITPKAAAQATNAAPDARFDGRSGWVDRSADESSV
jgi:hypothetical protein